MLGWRRASAAVAALAAAALGLARSPALAVFEVPGFELVYTAPAETSLAQGDLRHPAEVWIGMFDAAERAIDVAQFYVTPRPGETLDGVLDALERAAGRGVKVRFLAEKKFEKASKDGFERLRTMRGLELRVIDYGALSPGGIHHAKYLIVDSSQAYVGSQNFDWRSLKHIHELGLRVTEPGVVRAMQAVFNQDWEDQPRSMDPEAPGPDGAPSEAAQTPEGAPGDSPEAERAFLAASPPGRLPPGVRPSEAALERLIGSAERELAVELLDYSPLDRQKRFYPVIDNAVRSAQARGVKIRLLVSHWNTERPAVDHLKSLSLLPGVEIRVVTLPQAEEGYIPYSRVIHAKYAVVDEGMLWLGTSNWSGGYLDKSRNLEITVRDAGLAGRVRKLHQELWDSPYSQPLEALKDYPEVRR